MKIVIAPNEILRLETKPVKKISPRHLRDVKEMVKLTESFIDPEGVGLAAPQVGISERFFIAKFEDKNPGNNHKFVAVFNPKILTASKKERQFMEGCLSIPDYYGKITRPNRIKVSYMTQEGQIIEETLSGVNATIFQHEYDHLYGKLFIDLVMQQNAKLYKIVGKDKTGADIYEEIIYK